MAVKRLTVIAGPNGSGKTTIIDERLATGDLPELYISPDLIVQRSDYSHIRDERERYIAAMQDAEDFRKMLVRDGESFCFETVFSGPDKLDFLRFAKNYNYQIDLIFVGTVDESINVQRVQHRVDSGGHSVPVEKIRARWHRSFANLLAAIPLVDTVLLYDNSGTHHRTVASRLDGDTLINPKFMDTVWKDALNLLIEL